MKTATVHQLKSELATCTPDELIDLCLRLSKFKKENKELLTYLLLEAHDETGYVESIKMEIDQQFGAINVNSHHYIKKSVRKILRLVRKFSRYSQKKETEVELLIHFCQRLKTFKPSIQNNATLLNIHTKQLLYIKKTIATLHEDLQHDYQMLLDNLEAPV